MSQGIEEHVCLGWDGFKKQLKQIRNISSKLPTTLYRGHSDPRWVLSSKWERMVLEAARLAKKDVRDIVTGQKFREYKEGYLERFEDALVSSPSIRLSDYPYPKDRWALGRHFGLITPLLDWTESPYVAAYFAAEDLNLQTNINQSSWLGNMISYRPAPGEFGKPFVVYALDVTDEVRSQPDLDIFRSRAEGAFRMRAQAGWFTQLHNDHFVTLEDWLASKGLLSNLRRYLIPGMFVNEALADLSMMNISARSMFPDVHGAASFANLGYKNVLGGYMWTMRPDLVEECRHWCGDDFVKWIEQEFPWPGAAD